MNAAVRDDSSTISAGAPASTQRLSGFQSGGAGQLGHANQQEPSRWWNWFTWQYQHATLQVCDRLSQKRHLCHDSDLSQYVRCVLRPASCVVMLLLGTQQHRSLYELCKCTHASAICLCAPHVSAGSARHNTGPADGARRGFHNVLDSFAACLATWCCWKSVVCSLVAVHVYKVSIAATFASRTTCIGFCCVGMD